VLWLGMSECEKASKRYDDTPGGRGRGRRTGLWTPVLREPLARAFVQARVEEVLRGHAVVVLEDAEDRGPRGRAGYAASLACVECECCCVVFLAEGG